jgi:hypothetical protein
VACSAGIAYVSWDVSVRGVFAADWATSWRVVPKVVQLAWPRSRGSAFGGGDASGRLRNIFYVIIW